MDRREAADLDRWLTRPDDATIYDGMYCGQCKEILPAKPSYSVDSVRVHPCDGIPQVVVGIRGYLDWFEPILIAIGSDGESHSVAYTPACGTRDGGHEAELGKEIEPAEAEEWRHEPHFFAEESDRERVEVRVCSNGHENRERVV